MIVPLDGSELAVQAMPYAQLVARGLSIPIELVEAFDVIPTAVHGQGSMYVVDRMLEEARQRSQHYLAQVEEALRTEGYSASAATLPGAPHQAIADRASADPNALIVMSTHGRGGLSRWALGSVTDKVLHTVPNPMLIVRSGAGSSEIAIENVLVPLDGSELAELSLPHAASMAAALGTGLTLLRLSPTSDYYRHHMGGPAPNVTASAEFTEQWADDLLRVDAETADAYLDRIRRRLSMERPDLQRASILHLPHDNFAQAIIDQAEQTPSLVVMTTHGRGGIGRMLMGSVTDRVVRHSDAPVLVVRNWQEPAEEYIGALAPAAGA